MVIGKGKEGIIGGRGLISVMFTHVLKMRNMNNINHNGRYKTSLSIVLQTWRGNNIGYLHGKSSLSEWLRMGGKKMKDILVDDSVFVGNGYMPDDDKYCLMFFQDEHGNPGRFSEKYKAGDQIPAEKDELLVRLVIPNIESWYIILEQLMGIGNSLLKLPTK